MRARTMGVTLGMVSVLSFGCGGSSTGTGAVETTHSISGVVSGAITSGVTITLSGASSESATTGAGGAYAFIALADGTYTITPSFGGYVFTPAAISVTLAGTDSSGHSFVAAPPPPPPPLPPPAPRVLSALPADGTVTLDWAPSEGAASYVVYGATQSGVTPAGYASLPGALRVTTASPPAILTGLVNGTTYHLVVSAVASSGATAESGEVAATPERDCACPGWQVCDQSRRCVAPGREGEYLVGLNYHALSDHWQVDMPVPPEVDVFLPNYHLPGIRDAVRAQLAVLAAGGARVLKTQIWHVNDPLTGPHTYAFDFPPTAQQLRNLRDYVADVAAMPTPDGVPMELYFAYGWLGSSDFTTGTPETTLGSSRLPPATYVARMTETLDGEFDAMRGVYRTDGRPAVTLVYITIEMVVCATADDADAACLWPGNSQPFHNTQWFMRTFYPRFVARARSTGVIPSVYFLAGGPETNYLDPTWRDPWYPALDGHASMSWVYRGLRYLQEQGLPIPDRIDFTTTANPPIPYTTVATVIARIYDDLQAILPAFQSPPYRYAAAETFYYADDSVRVAGSKPFASERMLGRGLAGVMSWPEIRPGTPTYDFRPFETAGTVIPFTGLDPGFEAAGVGGLPAGWSADPPGPTVARRALVPDAHGGAAVLRLDGGACPGCGGVISDPVLVMPGQAALVRFWARSNVPQAGGRPPSPGYAGMAVQVRGSLAGVDTGALLDFGTVNTLGVWRRFVGVVEIPPGVDSLRLRFVLQNAGTGLVDVDDIH